MRLLLVRYASTRALRSASFAPDDALDARGREQAAALRGELPSRSTYRVAPCLAAFQTASLAGGAPVVVDSALADCDYGRWTGRTLAEVEREDPESVRRWLDDLDAVPHGGESMRSLIERTSRWLDEQALNTGTVVAVAPAAVIRAAVVRALDAPPESMWKIDIAPASVSELHAQSRHWSVTRINDKHASRSSARLDEASSSR